MIVVVLGLLFSLPEIAIAISLWRIEKHLRAIARQGDPLIIKSNLDPRIAIMADHR